MIKVGVVGGTGYTGVELLRLLAQHPQAELAAITSRAEAGTPVADMFPIAARPRGAGVRRSGERATRAMRRRVLRDSARRCDEPMRGGCVDAGVQDHRSRRGLPPAAISPSGRSGTSSTTPRRSSWREAVYGVPEINRAAIRSARIVGESRLLCDHRPARPPAARRVRDRRSRPLRRRREVGRERRGPQGRAAAHVQRGGGQLRRVQRCGPSPRSRDPREFQRVAGGSGRARHSSRISRRWSAASLRRSTRASRARRTSRRCTRSASRASRSST